MSSGRPLVDDRHIEFDMLAIVMLGVGFVIASAAAFAVIGNAAGDYPPGVMVVSAFVGMAVTGAWIFGYPRHATGPSISLVLMIATIVVPRVMNLGHALVPEAANIPPAHLSVISGLYVSGLALLLLAFLVCGFVGPLIGAVLRLRRGEAGARKALMLQVGLFGAACALVAVVAMLR